MGKVIAKNLVGWYALRWQILERDKFTCQYCGRSAPSVPLEVDHIIPRADGGTDQPDNLVCACWSCNRGKAAYFSMTKQKRGKISETSLATQIVFALSDGPKTYQELATLLGGKAATVRQTLARLAQRGRVVRVGGDGKGGRNNKSYWAKDE